MVRISLLHARALDRGNANPSNLGADFNRFSFSFWTAFRQRDAHHASRLRRLEELNAWRNAIAHQDFPAALAPPPPLHLSRVSSWRSACNGAVQTMDAIVADQMAILVGTRPC